jgi:hypothetical protein
MNWTSGLLVFLLAFPWGLVIALIAFYLAKKRRDE